MATVRGFDFDEDMPDEVLAANGITRRSLPLKCPCGTVLEEKATCYPRLRCSGLAVETIWFCPACKDFRAESFIVKNTESRRIVVKQYRFKKLNAVDHDIFRLIRKLNAGDC